MQTLNLNTGYPGRKTKQAKNPTTSKPLITTEYKPNIDKARHSVENWLSGTTQHISVHKLVFELTKKHKVYS